MNPKLRFGSKLFRDHDHFTYGRSVFKVDSSVTVSSVPAPEDLSQSNASAAAVGFGSEKFPSELIKGASPFRLLQDYASDDSSEDDVKPCLEEVGPVTASISTTAGATSLNGEILSNLQMDQGLMSVSSSEMAFGTFSKSVVACSPSMSPNALKFSTESQRTAREADVTSIASVKTEELVENNSRNQESIDNAVSPEVLQLKDTVDGVLNAAPDSGKSHSQKEDFKYASTLPKVDEFGRLVREGASDSDSEDPHYTRRRGKRGRSWSRSQSPHDRRRRSPRRGKEKRSRSRRFASLQVFSCYNLFRFAIMGTVHPVVGSPSRLTDAGAPKSPGDTTCGVASSIENLVMPQSQANPSLPVLHNADHRPQHVDGSSTSDSSPLQMSSTLQSQLPVSEPHLNKISSNVPPAILLRFLREHRSEWADSSIDAYSAAAVKVGPCSLPGSRVGSFSGQVILPLAHTIEHEELLEVIKLEGVGHCPEDAIMPRDMFLLQEASSPNRTLDLASALEIGPGGNKASNDYTYNGGSTRSVMTIAFEFAFEVAKKKMVELVHKIIEAKRKNRGRSEVAKDVADVLLNDASEELNDYLISDVFNISHISVLFIPF
ncbi:unnamed protein product [Camellia sinensis]